MTTSDRFESAGARRPLPRSAAGSEPDPADQAAAEDLLAVLGRIIDQDLPPPVRQVALAHWIDGKSDYQIAAELDLHRTSVRDRLVTASIVMLNRFGPALRELAPDLEAEARRRVGCLDDRRYGRITRINQRRRASRLTERNSRISPADARDIRPMLAAAPVLEVPHRVWHAISRAIDDPSPRRRAGLEFLRIRAVRFAESVRHLSASLDRLPRRHDDRPALRQRLRRRRAQLTRVLRVIDACTTLPSLRLGRRPERSPVFLEVA